jgi:hypothetical protein
MINDDDLTVPAKQVFRGRTERRRIEDGALILFGHGEEPPEPFREGPQIEVALPGGVTETLHCAPSHGHTHVEWFQAPHMHIAFRLERIESGVWKVHFEESHKGTLDVGTPPRM